MMRTPAFWSGGATWQSMLLAPLGWLYGAITLHRLARKGWRAPVPVISIGNFTAGGAGKTPAALTLAKALIAHGETPFFITRGYGGRERGPLRVDPARHGVGDVGDEPLLLALTAPTVVARDRAAGAELAVSQGASCLVLDDGLQNPDLEKDFSLAVIDGGFGFGNGKCVPAGPLRAPLAPMLAHVDAVIVVGEDRHAASQEIAGRVPVHGAIIAVAAETALSLKGRRVLGFCGIGRPEKFRATLEECGALLDGFEAFADHHRYSEAEARALIGMAERSGTLLVTTEKDHVRLGGSLALDALAARAMPVPIALDLAPGLLEAVYRALELARKR